MPSPLETCGNCVFFDINSCDGSPVGTVTIQDQEVSQGFCRTNNGLKLMAKKETDLCRQPEGTFKPKEGITFENTELAAQSSTGSS